MSVPRDERLSAARVALPPGRDGRRRRGHGRRRRRSGHPVRRPARRRGPQRRPDAWTTCPAELETEALPQKTKILDADGNTIATLYDENRVNVPLDQISRTMVKAIVAIEDYRFYQHGALDLKGTLRALVTNQANNGVVQGGSSITQQMVKLTLLSQANDQGGARGGHRRHLRPQAPRAALRDRLRAEPHQGLDPRALPQHRLLRRRRLRHPVRRPPLLQRQRQEPQPAPVGDARRPGQEPDRLRPDQLPGPARSSAATSCSTGWPSST